MTLMMMYGVAGTIDVHHRDVRRRERPSSRTAPARTGRQTAISIVISTSTRTTAGQPERPDDRHHQRDGQHHDGQLFHEAAEQQQDPTIARTTAIGDRPRLMT